VITISSLDRQEPIREIARSKRDPENSSLGGLEPDRVNHFVSIYKSVCYDTDDGYNNTKTSLLIAEIRGALLRYRIRA